MDLQTRMKSAIMAGIIGDTLGVPREYSAALEHSLCAVKNELGYGRFDHPEGTWSDDTSLALCTMESLCNGYNLDEMGKLFCRWMFEGYWTPGGYVFDSGLTTFLALDDLRAGRKTVRTCGQVLDDDNGNGSLMRILPVALYFRNKPVEGFLAAVHEISQITHAHPRSKMACGIYALLVRELINGADKGPAYTSAINQARDHYEREEAFRKESGAFSRILSYRLPEYEEDEIKSSGYVIDTLESAVWAFMKFGSTREILLKTVNIGLDTDTTGMAAGGLAGICHGLDDVPSQWVDALVRRSDIERMIDTFVLSALQQ
jgi:ADP-ribosylglycohydrolase